MRNKIFAICLFGLIALCFQSSMSATNAPPIFSVMEYSPQPETAQAHQSDFQICQFAETGLPTAFHRMLCIERVSPADVTSDDCFAVATSPSKFSTPPAARSVIDYKPGWPDKSPFTFNLSGRDLARYHSSAGGLPYMRRSLPFVITGPSISTKFLARCRNDGSDFNRRHG